MRYVIPVVTALLIALSCTWKTARAADNYRVEYQLRSYASPKFSSWDKDCNPAHHTKLFKGVDNRFCTLASDECFHPADDAKYFSWRKFFSEYCISQKSLTNTFSGDFCNASFKKTSLRVKAQHYNEDIQEFDCFTSDKAGDVAADKKSAKWSAAKACDRKNKNPDDAQLQYSWRAYRIPQKECGLEAKAASEEYPVEIYITGWVAANPDPGRDSTLEDWTDAGPQEKTILSAVKETFTKKYPSTSGMKSDGNAFIYDRDCTTENDKTTKSCFAFKYSMPAHSKMQVDVDVFKKEFATAVKAAKIPGVLNACSESPCRASGTASASGKKN
ncbi:uncharacterized protein LOC129596987 [Paramacrobiotus metropolitanus]|uniref:uncharacterized protein LOC129596987 n=1 Tax=Paramacrobiotus metropolitanus TaxID=2943436 RepID=UPI002445F1E1|nr:uncharacterized protein LOC129596987 [Paramacrobiotus metropolitanus]